MLLLFLGGGPATRRALSNTRASLREIRWQIRKFTEKSASSRTAEKLSVAQLLSTLLLSPLTSDMIRISVAGLEKKFARKI